MDALSLKLKHVMKPGFSGGRYYAADSVASAYPICSDYSAPDADGKGICRTDRGEEFPYRIEGEILTVDAIDYSGELSPEEYFIRDNCLISTAILLSGIPDSRRFDHVSSTLGNLPDGTPFLQHIFHTDGIYEEVYCGEGDKWGNYRREGDYLFFIDDYKPYRIRQVFYIYEDGDGSSIYFNEAGRADFLDFLWSLQIYIEEEDEQQSDIKEVNDEEAFEPELQVKTYLDRNPRGLVRVLFFAADEDYDKYCDKISDMILKLYPHVAIYYSRDPEDITDEILKEMRLAVFPATMAFLSADCKARKLLFDKIRQSHIALLPIGMDSGIVNLFNMICGDIQFLDAVSRDSSALSFEHKLINFLNDILIDEEQSKKIREAFDAYIFLSYRKKDRDSANKVMRLIHENDFMRDVAIWYDEFLTPGEDFSDSIRDALLKSKVMALVVTPNIINEENYVKNIEYPMARDAEKTVLPIQTVETDKDALKAGFAGLDHIVDSDSPQELSEALMEMFRREGFVENDDPDHLYFIALAYLYGIDVETDIDRGIALLDRSSRLGCIEASERLVQFYLQGSCVEADYQAAAEILTRITDQLKAKKASWTRREEYIEAINYLRELSKVLIHCREYDKAMHLSGETYHLHEEMDERFPGEWNELIRGWILWDICAACVKMDSMPQGLGDYCEEVCSIYFDYFNDYGYNAEWDILPLLKDMTTIHGEDQFMLGVREGGLAQQYFEEVSDRVKNDDDERAEKDICDLVYSYINMMADYSEYCLDNYEDMDEAMRADRISMIEDSEKMFKLATVLLSKYGRTEESFESMQRYFNTFGKFYLKIGEYDKAREMFQYAFQQLFEKYDEPDNVLRQCDNLRNLILLGDLKGDIEEQRYAHFALTELLERLYAATGADIFKQQLDENEAAIREKGIDV